MRWGKNWLHTLCLGNAMCDASERRMWVRLPTHIWTKHREQITKAKGHTVINIQIASMLHVQFTQKSRSALILYWQVTKARLIHHWTSRDFWFAQQEWYRPLHPQEMSSLRGRHEVLVQVTKLQPRKIGGDFYTSWWLFSVWMQRINIFSVYAIKAYPVPASPLKSVSTHCLHVQNVLV